MSKCPECNRTFGSPHAVKVHIARTHGPGWSTRPRKRRGRPRKVSVSTDRSLADVPTDQLARELGRRVGQMERIKAALQ